MNSERALLRRTSCVLPVSQIDAVTELGVVSPWSIAIARGQGAGSAVNAVCHLPPSAGAHVPRVARTEPITCSVGHRHAEALHV